MPIREHFRQLREVVKASLQTLPHEEEYKRLAADAYIACCEWFGTPPDAKRPYELLVSYRKNSFCGYALRSYRLYLYDYDLPQSRCRTIGHEMYHRVTTRRDGLHKEVWIDEMLACLASHWFLARHGYAEYAGKIIDQAGRAETSINFDALGIVRRRRGMSVPLSEPVYPPELYRDVVRIGHALEKLVSQQCLCTLPWSKSLPDWVQTLPEDAQGAVSDVLSLPGHHLSMPDDIGLRRKYGTALRMVGRLQDSLLVLEDVLRLTPDSAASHFEMSFIYQSLGRMEEARSAWERVTELSPQSFWPAYNVANSFHHDKNYPQAVHWYCEALRRKPDWPQALYYLGAALAYNEQVREARECWRRIVSLGDVEYSGAAQGSLENWRNTDGARNEESEPGYIRTVTTGEEGPERNQGVSHEDDPRA